MMQEKNINTMRIKIIRIKMMKIYFKQWGTWGEDMKKRSKKDNGHLLDNEIYREMPNK